MSITYRFIERPSEPSEVMAWFRALDAPITESQTPYGYALHFQDFGPVVSLPDGSINAEASPVVTVVLPEVRRGMLWTVGEVHFRSTPLRKQFPRLAAISRTFSAWLSQFECVFSNKRPENPDSYYLEGSSRNWDSPIYALPSGFAELRQARYFVSHSDNPASLDALCKKLGLRGVNCEHA